MRRQRNILQTKELEKIPEQKPREMEIVNLPDKEFKVVVIKMLIELERKIDHKEQILNKTKKLNNN